MKIQLPIGMEGIVTVECLDGDRVVHTQRIKNVLTDQGLAALRYGTYKLEAMSNVCYLGRKAHVSAPAASDTMANRIAGEVQFPNCADSKTEIWEATEPQPRAVVAVSTNNGGAPDRYEFHAGPEPYWSLTRTRVFSKIAAHFQAGELPQNADFPGGDWPADGWGLSKSVDASYIDEVGFCSQLGVAVFGPLYTPRCTPPPGQIELRPALWSGGILWNRVALPSTIGFEPDPGEQLSYVPWHGHVADITLSAESGLIRVTYEFRVYPDIAPVVQSMTIEGVATTVTTRLVDFDNPAIWGEDGFLGHFGYWKTDQYAAKLVETGSYGATINDPFTYGPSVHVDSAVQLNPGGFAQTQRYKAGPAKANYAGGIGFLAHGNFGGAAIGDRFAYVTQFDPPITKTAADRIQIDVRYTWSRR